MVLARPLQNHGGSPCDRWHLHVSPFQGLTAWLETHGWLVTGKMQWYLKFSVHNWAILQRKSMVWSGLVPQFFLQNHPAPLNAPRAAASTGQVDLQDSPKCLGEWSETMDWCQPQVNKLRYSLKLDGVPGTLFMDYFDLGVTLHFPWTRLYWSTVDISRLFLVLVQQFSVYTTGAPKSCSQLHTHRLTKKTHTQIHTHTYIFSLRGGRSPKVSSRVYLRCDLFGIYFRLF